MGFEEALSARRNRGVSFQDMRHRRAIAGLVGLAAACGHDEFPDRLKRGCGSAEECKRLLGDAAKRLQDCGRDERLGSSVASHWRDRCRYEIADCQVALDKARRWAKWANSPLTFNINVQNPDDPNEPGTLSKSK